MAITKDLLDKVVSEPLDPATGLQVPNENASSRRGAITKEMLDIVLNNPVSDPTVGAGSLGINPDKYKNYGGIPSNIKDLDEYRATNQSVGQQLAFGTGRLIGTTATKFLTGIGYTLSAVPAIVQGDINVMLDNAFSTAIEDIETSIKEDVLPIHHRRKYLEGGIMEQMGTFGFWMDDFVDGLAFMGSAIVGAKGLDKIGSAVKAYTRLAKLASRGMRAAKTGRLAGELSPRLANTAKFLDYTTINLYNSVTEGAFEAKEVRDQIRSELAEKVKSGEITQVEADLAAAKAARNTMLFNVAALMPSNAITNAMVFKKFDNMLPGLGYAGKIGKTVKPLSKLRQAGIFGKSALLSAASEGLYEENIQTAIKNYEADKINGFYSDDFVGAVKGIFGGMVANLFTDEGQKSIALGSLIGLLPGGVSGLSKAKAENKRIRNTQAAYAAFLDNYKQFHPTKIYKTKQSTLDPSLEVLDMSEGKPIVDPNKIQSTAMGFYQSYADLAASLKALNSGNQFMFDYIKNKNLGTVVAGFHGLEGNMDAFEEWLDFQIEEEKEAYKKAEYTGDTSFLQDMKQTYLNRAKKYFRTLDEIDNNMLSFISLPDTEKAGTFKTILKSEQLNESLNQVFFEEKLQEFNNQLREDNFETPEEKQAVKRNIEQLNTLLEESRSKVKELFNYKIQEKRFQELSKEIEDALETKDTVDSEVSTQHTSPTQEDLDAHESGTTQKVGDKNVVPTTHGLLSKSNEYIPANKIFDTETALANGYEVDETGSMRRQQEEQEEAPTSIRDRVRNLFSRKSPEDSIEEGEESTEGTTSTKPTVFYKSDKENKLLHTVVTDAEGNIIRDTLTKQVTLFDAVTEDKKEVGINFVNGKLENIKIKDVKSGKVTTSKPSSDIASHGPNNISDILALLTLERGLVRNTELEDLGDLKARISRQVNENSLQYAPNIAREVTKLTNQLKQELENVPANEQAQYREDFVRRYYGDESKASSTISQIFEDGAITYVPAIYLGKVGIMENVDGEIVFKAVTSGGKKESTEYLISNITNPESIDSLGITVLKQMPFEFQILHDGRTYNIQDVYYTNNFENPTDAVAYDNDGFPVSVTLWDYNNNKIEFTNPFIVEHISYAIELQQTVEEETVEGTLRGENDFIMFEHDNSLYAAYRLPNGSLRFVSTETNRPISGRLHAKVREEYTKQLHEAAEALSAAKLKIVNSTKKHVKNAIRQHVPAIRSALTGEALKLPDTREVQDSKRIQEKPERSKKAKQETNDIIDKVASEAAKAEIARKQQAELDKQAEKEAAADSVQDLDDIVETSNESAETKIPDSGIRHSATAVAYVHLDPTTGTTKANNLNFAQDVINSPVESFQFSAEIDREYAKFWDAHPELREELKKGRLSSERIEELLAAEGTVFDKLVDTIPVKFIVTSENKPDKPYENGIYMHESGYDNINPPSELYSITDYDKFVEEYIKYKNKIKEQTRQLRRKVISDLLSGNPVTFSGSNKTMGHPNNVGTNSNILTVLQKVKPGIDARSVNLLVAKRPGVVTEANNKISDVPLIAAPGNVFLETDATANGEFGYIKLNPSKLSIEHARIVLKAFRQAYTKGKGGFKAKYEGKDVTGGLTVLEVLNNLVYYSEDNTKINPKDKRKSHLLPKQLYVDSRYILHFGNNTMPLFTNEEAEIKRFLDWAHTTKNYAVNASMIGRNFKGKDKFSIGSATYDSSVDNYTSFILKNGFLLTDVDKVENTNSLYKDPVIGIDTGIQMDSSSNNTVSNESAAKPTTPEKKEASPGTVQPAEVVPESKNLTKENPNVDTSTYNKKVAGLNTTRGLHTLPIGTKVYIPIKEGGVQTDYPIGEVVYGSKTGSVGFRLKPDFKGHMVLVELGRKLSTLKSFAFQDTAALNAFNDALSNTNMSKYVYFDSPAASVAPTAEESQATTETELKVPDNTEAVKAEEIRKVKEEADKNTIEESSPAESIEEQASNTTGRRGLTPEQKAKMQQDEQKSASKKNLPNPLDRKGPKGLNDIFNPFNRLVDTAPREYTPADVKAEIKALNKRLRANKFGTPIPTKIVDGLIHVARDRKAFAQFRADGFLLSNLAESGSLLHEAFHRVSLLYLTPEQRNTIYSEAKSLYGLKEDATNLEIEETLAEKYREYALIRQERPEVAAKMSIGKKIAKFFKDLYDFLYTWFTGTTRLDSYDVATLFKAIDNGKFKFARTRKDNLKELGGNAYNFEIKGVNVESIQTTAEYREIVQNLFYLLAESNRLIETDYATGETSIRISSFQDVKNIKFGPLYSTVRRLSLEHNEVVEASDVAIEYLKETPDISTEELNQIQREYLGEKYVGETRIATISRLNSQADVADRIATIFGEVYDKFDTFKAAVEDYMHSMNIMAIRDESDIDLTEVDEDSGSNMSDYDRYNKTSYMVSAKENTALSIKLLISMLPAESGRSELTGMFKFVEFSPMWSRLMNTLIGMRNVEDMMSKLERASVDSVPYQILVRKLNNDEVLKTQFYRTMQKYKHNFINFLVSEDGIRISTAAVQQASTRYVKDWGTAFTKNTNFFKLDPSDKNKLKGNLELFQDKIDVFENLLISVSNDINRTGEVVDLESKINTLVELLNDVNIPIDSTSIRYGLARMNEVNDSVGFRSLLLNNIPHIFSTKSTLYKVLNGEQLMGHNKKPTSIENIFVYEKGISYLASIFSESRIQELGDSIYGPQGNRYYTIAQNTYISDLLREIKTDLYGFLDKVSQSAYAQNSVFLQQLIENPELANKLDLLTISSFQREDVFDMGREYQALTPMEDTLMRMSAIESGKLVPPTPADRRFYYLYDGFTTLDVSVDSQGNLSDNVLDVFVGYAKDEIARIHRVRKDVDDVLAGKKSSEDLFETYHYRRYIGKGNARITDISKGIVDGKVLKEDGKYTGRGATFTDFVGLDLKMTDQELRTAVNEFLKDRIRDTEGMLTELNIVNTFVENGTKQHYTISLLENWIDKHQKITGDRNAAIADIIANFTVNTAFAAIETGKVFTGDPAAFKSSEDYVKRLPGATSTGDNLRTDFPAEYMPGERLIHSSTYNVSTFSSNVVESEFFEPLVKLHAEYYYEKGMVDSMEEGERIATEKLEGLLASDRTDAQTFISPEMYRAISIRLGKWTDAKENAYTILQSGEELSRLQAVELSDIVMEPLKMTYMDVMNRGGHAVPVFDKMSMSTLFRPMVQGTVLENLLDRMEAKGEYQGLTPVDHIKFHTAEKVGIKDRRDFFKEGTEEETVSLKDIALYPQRFDRLRYQLVTDPHDVSTTMVGSQVKKIGISNIYPNDTYYLDGFTEESTVSGKDLRRHVSTLLGELSNRGKNDLFNRYKINEEGTEFTDLEALTENLREEARKASLPDYVIENIKVGQDGRLYANFDSFPGNRAWIQSRLISVIKKAAIDLNMPGNAFIQMSDLGVKNTEKDASLSMLNDRGYTEAKVSVALFKNMIPGYAELTHEERVEYLKKTPEITSLGYRVPTQGQNSVYLMEIVDFLPDALGDTIILPKEGPALGGFDFDIDKMYVIRHHYRNGEKVRYLHEGNSTVEERAGAYAREAESEKISKIRKEASTKIKELAASLQDYRDGIKYAKEQIEGLGQYIELGIDLNESIEAVREQREIKEYNYKRLEEVKQEIKAIKEEVDNSISQIVEDWKEANIESFSELSLPEQNTKQALENRLLDSYFSVLTNRNHLIRRTTPLGYTANIMKELAAEVRKYKDIVEEVVSPLARVSPVYQLDVKSRYKFGGEGLGPFALANVHHVLGQAAEISLFDYIGVGNSRTTILSLPTTEETAPASSEHIYTDLSQILGQDGIDITEWFSGLIDAHVDIAADPYVYYLNVNEYTRNVLTLLLRSGVGGIKSMLFTSQPILETIASKLENRGNVMGNTDLTPAATIREEYEISYAELSGKEAPKANTAEDVARIFNEDYLRGALQMPSGTAEYYRAQLEILDVFEFLQPYSEALKEATMASRVDTKKFGSSYSEVSSFKNRILKAYKDSNNGTGIRNFDRLMEETYLNEYTQNSIEVISSLFSGVTLEGTTTFNRTVNDILELTGKQYSLDSTIIPNIVTEIYSEIYGEFFNSIGLNKKKASQLLSLDNGIATTVANIKSGTLFPELKNNAFIRALQPRIQEEGPQFVAFHKPDNVWYKEELSRAWKDIFSGNQQHVELAKDLFLYSFLTSGFRSTLHSFHDLVPIELVKYVGLDTFIKNKMVEFNSPSIDNSTLVNNVIKSLWNNSRIVPEIYKIDRASALASSSKTAVIMPTNTQKIFSGYNRNGQRVYSPIIKYKNNMYEYLGYLESTDKPVYGIRDKKGYRKSGFTVKESSFPTTMFSENTSGVSKSVLDMLTPENFYQIINVSPKAKKNYTSYIGVTDLTLVTTAYEAQANASSTLLSKSNMFNPLSEDNMVVDQILQGETTVIGSTNSMQNFWTLPNGQIVFLELVEDVNISSELGPGYMYTVYDYGFKTPSFEEIEKRILEC